MKSCNLSAVQSCYVVDVLYREYSRKLEDVKYWAFRCNICDDRLAYKIIREIYYIKSLRDLAVIRSILRELGHDLGSKRYYRG